MGLIGYRLWAMGQLDSNVQSPASISLKQLRGVALTAPYRASRSPM
jgi:hypothetical protein